MEISDNLPILREANPRLIFGHIRASGSICRAEIARITGLHPSTITRIVASLFEHGLVQEDGEGYNSLGRKSIMLRLVPGAVHAIGIAVESTFISGILVNLDAQIIREIEVPLAETTVEAVTGLIRTVIHDLMDFAKQSEIMVLGIGVAMHGVVDSKNGISVFAPAMGWRSMPVGAMIAEYSGLPVRVDNNANAMALGESWFGNGKGVANLLALKIGRSIGSGIILNGHLFPGADYSAGEIGHTNVVLDGQLCECGNYGCLETVASIDAVLKKGRVALKMGDESSLLAMLNDDPDRLNHRALFEATKSGDRLALQLWEEAAGYLGLALANAINILNPAKILIGGDILPVVDYVLPKMQQIVAVRAFETLRPNLVIEPVGLGSQSVAIGAATLILKEVFE